jgi:transposase
VSAEVWDNLNIHKDGPSERWTEFNARHGGRFHFHYTPIHASWVNQIESWFAILQKRVLRHGVFDSVEALEERVAGFIRHWNADRHPFWWTFKGYPLEARESAA